MVLKKGLSEFKTVHTLKNLCLLTFSKKKIIAFNSPPLDILKVRAITDIIKRKTGTG